MAAYVILVCAAILLPFPFYWFLWKFPQAWVEFCGLNVDPCHRMAQVSTFIKLIQFTALISVSTFSWPPFYCWILILVGQFLNIRVYQLLGEDAVYYGVRFGKKIPWVHDFPFGYIKDPQYVGSSLTLLGCLYWAPWPYVMVWIAGYIFMSILESKENEASRAKPLRR